MKLTYFGQCSCCISIDKNNYIEETELGTYPSLTEETESTAERSCGHFVSNHC